MNLKRLVCLIKRNHKYDYYSGRCVRCGKLKDSKQ